MQRTAVAAEVAGGVIGIEGRATLPASPCPTGCFGTFDGVANVSMSGVTSLAPWTAASALIPITFTFPYFSSCLAGLGAGTVSIRAVPVEAFGAYVTTAIGHVYDVVGFDLPLTLDWLQVGPSVIVQTTGSLTLTIDDRNLVTGTTTRFSISVIAAGLGAGAGAFAGERVPECFGPGPAESQSLVLETTFLDSLAT
jgi:hypothetical protein